MSTIDDCLGGPAITRRCAVHTGSSRALPGWSPPRTTLQPRDSTHCAAPMERKGGRGRRGKSHCHAQAKVVCAEQQIGPACCCLCHSPSRPRDRFDRDASPPLKVPLHHCGPPNKSHPPISEIASTDAKIAVTRLYKKTPSLVTATGHRQREDELDAAQLHVHTRSRPFAVFSQESTVQA
jgi:hypothetical protein